MKDGIHVPSEFVKARRRAAKRYWQEMTVMVCGASGGACGLWNVVYWTCNHHPQTCVWFECIGLVLLIAAGVIVFVKLLLSIPPR